MLFFLVDCSCCLNMFQVKVLELEQALQQERLKLGTLRKKHYELAELKEFDEQVK